MVKKCRVSEPYTETGISQANGVSLDGDGEEYRFSTYLQSVDTLGHPYRQLGKVRRNIGGHFVSKRYDVDLGNLGPWTAKMFNLNGSERYHVKTHLVPSTALANRVRSMASLQNTNDIQKYSAYVDSIVPSPMSNAQLNALGAKAVSMFQPLNPVADTTTTIAEFISERKLFSVPGTSGSLPGEYLNYQFGIAPSIGYAQDLRKAIEEKEEILSQLQRDSGRWIRRRGVVYDEKETTSSTSNFQPYPGCIGPPLNSALGRGGVLRTTTHFRVRAWFSGAFTYYLPKEGTMWRTVSELDKLYGVKPNVDTAWELLPFSWLLDYKTNAGHVLKNLSAFTSDGLVMPYGYIMCQTTRENEYEWTGQLRDSSGSWRDMILHARDHQVTKQRLHANPFGFGLLPGDLSGRQWSILAALGLSYLT